MSKSATYKGSESRLRKYSTLLLNFALIGVAFFGVSAFQARNMLTTDRMPAPELRASTLVGTIVDLGELDTRPTIVYFFAPWCHYCAFSSDNLVRLRNWRDEQNLRIISVALDWESVAEVREYAAKHKLNIPVLLGDPGIAEDWKVYAFPTYYVLDEEHRVVRRDLGYSTQLGLWWRSYL